MSEERKLRIWTNDCEWVIAYDVADIRAIFRYDPNGIGADKVLGDEVPDAEWAEQWTEEDGAKMFTFVDDDKSERKTMAEWIALKGRGYFATTEI